MVMFTRYGAVLLAGTLIALLVLAAQGVGVEGIAAAFFAAMIPLALTESALAREHERRFLNLLSLKQQHGGFVVLQAPGLTPFTVRGEDLKKAITVISRSRHASWRQRQYVLGTLNPDSRVILLDMGDFIVLNFKPAGNRGHRILIPADRLTQLQPS